MVIMYESAGIDHCRRVGSMIAESLPGLPKAKLGPVRSAQEKRRSSPVTTAVSWRVRRGRQQQQHHEQQQQQLQQVRSFAKRGDCTCDLSLGNNSQY